MIPAAKTVNPGVAPAARATLGSPRVSGEQLRKTTRTEIEQSSPSRSVEAVARCAVRARSVQRGYGASAKEIDRRQATCRVARLERARTAAHWSAASRDRRGRSMALFNLTHRRQAGDHMMTAASVTKWSTANMRLLAFAAACRICLMKAAISPRRRHRWHPAVVDRDGPSDRRRPRAPLFVAMDLFACATGAFNLVETGPSCCCCRL